jgi:hypothetical protein
LEENAERGMAFIDEHSCVDLLREFGVEPPSEDPKGGDRKMELALSCLKCIRPEWTEVEATKALNKGFILEHPDCYDDIVVPDDILEDVLNNADGRKARAMSASHELLKGTRKEKASIRARLVPKYYGKTKSAASLKTKPLKGKAPRFFPKAKAQTKDATKWLKEHMPESVRLAVDDRQGRWYVVFKDDVRPRSISWTKRGYAMACSEVLHTAWVYHVEDTGEYPPFDIEELVSHFTVDLVEHAGEAAASSSKA